jgi:hypothetical protein
MNDIEVMALDTVGNTATIHLAVVLDTVPPTASVTATVGGEVHGDGEGAVYTREAQVLIHLSSNEDVIVEMANGTSFPLAAGDRSMTVLLKEGVNGFTYSMSDSAGNGAGPFVFSIVLDTFPPELEILSPAHGTVVAVDQVLVRGRTETGVTISVSGAVPIVYPNGSFEALVPLAQGPNSVVVRVTDSANNTAVETVQVFREDREEPRPSGGVVAMVVAASLLAGFLATLATLHALRRSGRDADESQWSGEPETPGFDEGPIVDERQGNDGGSGPG